MAGSGPCPDPYTRAGHLRSGEGQPTRDGLSWRKMWTGLSRGPSGKRHMGIGASSSPAQIAHNQLRLVTQYGNMTQSYKLVLARSLLDIAAAGRSEIGLDELAVPYAQHLCRHTEEAPLQGMMRSGILVACQAYNDGRIEFDEVVDTIVTRGFRYLLDAFPVLSGRRVRPIQLYERLERGRWRGLALDDTLLELGASAPDDAIDEVEARWRLVEHSWESRSRHEDNRVRFQPNPDVLVSVLQGKRRRIAHFRPALNSYHRDRYFYCRSPISLRDPAYPSHIDHVFPHIEMIRTVTIDLDDVWNLVLTCVLCNLSKRDRHHGAATPNVPSDHRSRDLEPASGGDEVGSSRCLNVPSAT